ncbi:MAG: hypothetical protein KGJ06_05175 [Pseudomonadota bacterium]|nr:hypothetical protein [Pseudomonadota bacterium]
MTKPSAATLSNARIEDIIKKLTALAIGEDISLGRVETRSYTPTLASEYSKTAYYTKVEHHESKRSAGECVKFNPDTRQIECYFDRDSVSDCVRHYTAAYYCKAVGQMLSAPVSVDLSKIQGLRFARLAHDEHGAGQIVYTFDATEKNIQALEELYHAYKEDHDIMKPPSGRTQEIKRGIISRQHRRR